MKYLLILLFLVGCTSRYNDCKEVFNPEIPFGTKIEITSGFYKGQVGYVIEQAFIFNVDTCNGLAFKVAINHSQNVVIKQTEVKKLVEQEPKRPYEVKGKRHQDIGMPFEM